jgi:hypothetical protein
MKPEFSALDHTVLSTSGVLLFLCSPPAFDLKKIIFTFQSYLYKTMVELLKEGVKILKNREQHIATEFCLQEQELN